MMPRRIHLPCGSSAVWDSESDMGYRCTSCFAMHGSIGQPTQCQSAVQKWKNHEALGGLGWDYNLGEQKKNTACTTKF